MFAWRRLLQLGLGMIVVTASASTLLKVFFSGDQAKTGSCHIMGYLTAPRNKICAKPKSKQMPHKALHGEAGNPLLVFIELKSIFPTSCNGHGLILRDYTELQEGPLCPLLRAP